MPKGYIIFTEDIRDQAGIDAYASKAIPSLMQAGGRVVVADPAPVVLEGEWHGPMTIVLEFDSVDAARAWYESDDYQAIRGERLAAADSKGALLAGFG